MEKEINIETAKSKCSKIPVDAEYEQLFQTKRNNSLPQNIDIEFLENNNSK